MRTLLNEYIVDENLACNQKLVANQFCACQVHCVAKLLPHLPDKSGMVFVGRDNEFCFVGTCLRYNGSLGAECKCEDSFR